MALPPLHPPPRGPLVGKDGILSGPWAQWFEVLYRKLGEAGKVPSESVSPNLLKNVTNDAVANSIDAGSSATVRVYGPGGVGSNWNRYRDALLIATHAAVTFTGKAYSTRYYIGYDSVQNTWVISTAYKDVTADQMVIFSVKTVDAGGAGGSGGGGGQAEGGSGGFNPAGDGGYGLIL